MTVEFPDDSEIQSSSQGCLTAGKVRISREPGVVWPMQFIQTCDLATGTHVRVIGELIVPFCVRLRCFGVTV